MFKKSEISWPDGDGDGKGCALFLLFVGVGIVAAAMTGLHLAGAL